MVICATAYAAKVMETGNHASSRASSGEDATKSCLSWLGNADVMTSNWTFPAYGVFGLLRVSKLFVSKRCSAVLVQCFTSARVRRSSPYVLAAVEQFSTGRLSASRGGSRASPTPVVGNGILDRVPRLIARKERAHPADEARGPKWKVVIAG